MNDERKCKFILQNGEQCQAWALRDRDFCFSHDDSSREAKIEAVRKGGLVKEIEIKIPLQKIEVDAPRDVIYLLARIIEEVRSGQIDVRVASALGYLSGVLLKAFEVSHSADGGWQIPDKRIRELREINEEVSKMAEEDRLALAKIIGKYAKPPEES